MIQKFQTYITRFINWLENNSETNFIRSILSCNEDMELSRLFKQMKYLNGVLRTYLDKITNISMEYERVVNQAYSHIKRKQKFIKISHTELKEVIGTELSAYNIQDAILVATRLQKMLEHARTKPQKAKYEIIVVESETLSTIVLNIFKDIPTVENSLRKIEEKNNAK